MTPERPQELDRDPLGVEEVERLARLQPAGASPHQDRRGYSARRRLLGIGGAADDRPDLEQADVGDAAREVALAASTRPGSSDVRMTS